MLRQTLHDALDRKSNALNALRLLLAVAVIFWHSYPITGRTMGWVPAQQLLGDVWVDGFFAISGYLILGSWLNTPSPARYLRARATRILPAFYVCLIVTAAVIAPIGILLSDDGQAPYSVDSLTYVVKNAALWLFQFDIVGSPSGVPYPGVWNGSLWTLFWEFLCYLAVLGVGVTGLLRYRATIPLLFAACWLASIVAAMGLVESENFHHAARFGLAFTAGSVVYFYSRKLPVSWPLVTLALVITVASSALPSYQLIAAPFLAYGLIGVGALAKHKRLALRNDLSYGMYIYAFPAQQMLAILGLAALPVWGFALASVTATLPLAAASWFMVEKPMQRLSKKGTARRPPRDPHQLSDYRTPTPTPTPI